jgi:hypothetical protein
MVGDPQRIKMIYGQIGEISAKSMGVSCGKSVNF